MKDVDGELARATRQRVELEAQVGDAALGGDHAELARLGEALASVEHSVRALEERWLELADELEQR
jgi:predicted nuclease with TOPRIM domain